jgi:N utilization substance protein B
VTDEAIPGGIGSRRAARERAVELAYEAEVRSISAQAILDSQLTHVDPFVVDLLNGAEKDRARSDELITNRAQGWTLSRIATMDKVVMRLAISELISSDIPVGVILNEAVALAGRYSTAESSRFVNGVLSAVATDVRGNRSSNRPAQVDDNIDG